MKNLFLQLFFVGLSINLFSQNLVWSKQIKGTNCCSYSEGKAITKDTSGNIYTTGVFRSPLPNPIDFDPGPGTYTFATPTTTTTSLFVSKLDNYGNFIWAKQFLGTDINADSRSIAVDDSNNVYVTGFFKGTVDFDPGPGTYALTSTGLENVFILKLDQVGNLKWAKQVGGGQNSYGLGITVDKKHNVYTTGYFFSTCDFDPGIGVNTYTAFGSAGCDAFILKLDYSGNFVWVKQLGSSVLSDEAYAIALDDSSNVFACGSFASTVDFDPGPSTYTLTSYGSGDIFIIKLDSSGNFRFVKQMGGGSSIDTPISIFLDKNKNIYTTGIFNNSSDFDPGVSSYSLTATTVNTFISKLDQLGNFIWAKSLSSGSPIYGYSIGVDTLGNVYTGGIFQATVDFDPGPSTYTLMSSGGFYNMFVSKLDASGNFIWAKQIEDPFSNDYLRGIVVDKKQNVFSTGLFRGSVDFDPNAGVYTMTSTPGGQDAFILKLGLCPAPMNTTSAANLTVCGNTTALSASGTGTINWYASPTSTTILGTGPTYFTPFLAPGSYTYFVEAINSCTINPVRTAIQIIINALPTVSIASNSSLVCSGQSATLTASGASTYTWSTSSTASVIAVTPTTTTTYSVIGKGANGCQNTFSLTQNFSQCVSIEELANQNLMYYYPNPFSDCLIVKSTALDSMGIISIYNYLGQLVSKTNGISEENKINLAHLSIGVYLMEVKLDGKLISKKIVKQ